MKSLYKVHYTTNKRKEKALLLFYLLLFSASIYFIVIGSVFSYQALVVTFIIVLANYIKTKRLKEGYFEITSENIIMHTASNHQMIAFKDVDMINICDTAVWVGSAKGRDASFTEILLSHETFEVTIDNKIFTSINIEEVGELIENHFFELNEEIGVAQLEKYESSRKFQRKNEYFTPGTDVNDKDYLKVIQPIIKKCEQYKYHLRGLGFINGPHGTIFSGLDFSNDTNVFTLYCYENYFSIDREKDLPLELKGKLGLIDRDEFRRKVNL